MTETGACLLAWAALAFAVAAINEPAMAEAPDPEAEQALPPLVPASVPPPAPSLGDEIDFRALREAYGSREDYFVRCEQRTQRERASSALVDEQFERVLEITRPLLESCPVDASLHLWRGAALYSLGREEEAGLHKRWYLGLVQSILGSGDGDSPESPFVTISVPEEYVVLSHLRLKPLRQFQAASPTMLDGIEVEDSAGKRRTVYFNPALHYARLLHQLR